MSLENKAEVEKAARDLKRLAGNGGGGGGRIKRAIDRAASRSRLPHNRVREIWYGRARRIEPFERAMIDPSLGALRKDVRNELEDLRQRFARLEMALSTIDEDFYGPDIDALGAALRPVR